MEQQDSVLTDLHLTANYEDFLAFVASPVWLDLKQELTTQRELIIEALGTADKPRSIYRLQGQLEACNDFLSMPTDIIKLIEEQHASVEVSEAAKNLESDYSVTDHDAYYQQLTEKFVESD